MDVEEIKQAARDQKAEDKSRRSRHQFPVAQPAAPEVKPEAKSESPEFIVLDQATGLPLGVMPSGPAERTLSPKTLAEQEVGRAAVERRKAMDAGKR